MIAQVRNKRRAQPLWSESTWGAAVVSGPLVGHQDEGELKTKLLDHGLEEMGMFSQRKNRRRGK